ncbi:hypothetical protein [Salininema proteolyticum]|uniref:Uncharacterized protein n=1 Tax=Salininema proteolyticum TaxID=1607685 RepID=A0ABV8U1A0_9ACTN
MFDGKWKIARHPAAVEAPLWKRPARRPGVGRVQVIVESRRPDRAGFAAMAPVAPYPNTPVLLVDGRPVTQGIGEVWLELAPGRHHFAVQSGRTSGYWILDVEEEQDYRLDEFTRYGRNEIRRDVFLSERFMGSTGGGVHGRLHFTAQMVLGIPMILSLPYLLYMFVVTTVLGDGAEADRWLWAGLWYFPAAVLLTGVLILVQYVQKKNAPERVLPPLEHGAITLLPYLEKKVPGGSGVVLDFQWGIADQEFRAKEYDLLDLREHGQPFMPRTLYWMRPPRIASGDGVSEAFWGRVWMPLAPGRHELRLGVPRQASQGDAGREPEYLWEDLTVDVEPEGVVHVVVQAEARQDVYDKDYDVVATGLFAFPETVERDGELPDFFDLDLPERTVH